jgi:predicted metal-dependent phosphoesterase TrpH
MKFADLHLHTHFSDGTFSPEELAGHGQRLGFAALALTDHDSVEGCARMAAACGAAGIEFIVRHGTHRRTRRTPRFTCSAISWTRKTKNC